MVFGGLSRVWPEDGLGSRGSEHNVDWIEVGSVTHPSRWFRSRLLLLPLRWCNRTMDCRPTWRPVVCPEVSERGVPCLRC